MTTQEQLISLGSNWPEDARRAYLQLSEVITNLSTQLTAQEHEIEGLKERLNKTSRNSHKPPSSDPPSSKPKAPPKANRKRKDGQKAHPGAQRQLLETTTLRSVSSGRR